MLGLVGGTAAGALFGVALSIFWYVAVPGYSVKETSLAADALGAAAVSALVGLITGILATATFLIIWAFSRYIRSRWLSRLLPSLGSTLTIVLLFLLYLKPDGNLVGNTLYFNPLVLTGCLAAGAAYFVVSSRSEGSLAAPQKKVQETIKSFRGGDRLPRDEAHDRGVR